MTAEFSTVTQMLALKVTDSCQARLQAPATGTLHVIRSKTASDSKFISFPSSPSSPPSHNTAPQIIPHLTTTQAEVLHSRKLTLELLVCERAPMLRLPSMPPGQLSHRLCKSEQPNNTGLFSESEVGENAEEEPRRDYMFKFLRWMRKETRSNCLRALEMECKQEVDT